MSVIRQCWWSAEAEIWLKNGEMRQNIIFSSANRWRGLPSAHPSGHRQDPVNQVRTRPEDLQLHPHAEERGRRVRPSSINTYLLTFDKISWDRFHLSSSAIVQLHERNKWKPSSLKTSISPLLLPPLSMMESTDQPWGRVFTWYHEDLYRVCLLNH